jgi:pantoate--beta-alanine ligase
MELPRLDAPTELPPKIIRDLPILRRTVAAWRAAGDRVGLVPTMGALHDGHLALVAEAKRHAQRVAVSIFVNPKQFAANEDLAKYPRTFQADIAKLATGGADAVWAPDAAIMYPEGFATRIVPEGAALGLEADYRPHFFQGVATVCTKLFTQVAPDVAVFGEKDWQQLAVVRQVVRDLDLPLAIVGLPTVRESDGLAMSSRNRYLTPAERAEAPRLIAELRKAAAAIGRGESPEAATAHAAAALTSAGWRVDYVTEREGRLLVAAWLGGTRLIDNIATAG